MVRFGRLVGYSGIYVSGVITENTVWTRSNSPYIVSGHIGVERICRDKMGMFYLGLKKVMVGLVILVIH